MQKERNVDGCCRAWGVLLGAISMYKGWSFSKKKKARKQKVGKVLKGFKIIKKQQGLSLKVEIRLLGLQNWRGTLPELQPQHPYFQFE